MTKIPKTVATITGPDGFRTCYVDVSALVADYGAINGSPTVAWVDTGTIVGTFGTISDVSTSESGNINGKDYSAGDLISFVVTNTAEANSSRDIEIAVSFGDPVVLKKYMRVRIEHAEYTTA